MLKLLPKITEPLHVLWSFFLLNLFFIFINLLYDLIEYCCHVWVGAPNCQIGIQDHWCVISCFSWTLCWLSKLSHYFLIYITLVDAHRNWLTWFHFVILAGGYLVVLIGCIIFLSALIISFSLSRSSLSSSFSCNSMSCSGCSALFGRLKKRFQ